MSLPQTRFFGAFFGPPWPSGICDEGTQVATPVGEDCALCNEPIEADHQGSFVGVTISVNGQGHLPGLAPVHKECSLREVMGGIGHLQNHSYWCREMHDPDGGRTRRQSSLEVWDWVADHGFPTRDEP